MKNILGCYLMPHPPLAISTIGKGEERKIQSTLDSCDIIGREISSIKPEIIIIITPHGTMFSDAIAISNEESIQGNLEQFMDFKTYMNIKIDKGFNKNLINICEKENIPAALIDSNLLSRFNRTYGLDHGSIVPLHFVNKYYNNYKLVHITYAAIGNIDLYRFGMALQKTINMLNKKSVIIASGDLSHRLTKDGPYDYSPQGKIFDEELLLKLQKGDVIGVFNMDKCLVEDAGECGLRSVYILLGAMEGNKVNGNLLSYEGPFGVGYGVMRFESKEENVSNLEKLMNKKKEDFNKKISSSNSYVKLARESLNYYYSNGKMMKHSSCLPKEMLNNKHGVFVSIKKFNQLRGCIGTILPTTNSVAEEIIRNSIKAATEDPRFIEVSKDELEDLDISVDVLTEPIKATKEELNPKIYGVIVNKGRKRGLLLPNLEGVNTVEEQLSIACEKAGINPLEDYEIEKFEVMRYEEGE